MNKYVDEFEDYISTLGYSSDLVYDLSISINVFFRYIKNERKKAFSKISKTDIDSFINHIQFSISERTNKLRSPTQINNYIYCLRHFNNFLLNIHNKEFPIYHIEYLKENRRERTPLLISEVKKLFDATDNTKYGMRDRAMLVLYYSCGLRRNEGINIETTDIDFKRRILFVREGKYGKQRYVPFTEQSKQYLEEYINIGRRRFIYKAKKKKRKTLFISYRGDSLDGQSLLIRLKKLAEKAKIDKEIGLHVLRHSIATHLLQKGMSIYDIATFLGHSSIETTQIYTHITEDDF